MKHSFIILLFHLLSLIQPYSLQSQTAIIRVDDFLYERGIQLVEEIIISSVPNGYSLISDILLIGIQDILPENSSFVIISNGKASYDSLFLQMKGIESKAMPGYGLFGIDPYLFLK